MLVVTFPSQEFYDEAKQEFVYLKEQKVTLEHSLLSVSKWESKWKKPFLSYERSMTREELIDYIKFMTVTKNVDPLTYTFVPKSVIDQIIEYISDPMTATTIKRDSVGKSRRIVTSELIYCWMASLGIPWECQKWHLNRLMTLIQVCSNENRPPKKMGRQATMRQNKSLNSARKKALGTKG